MPSNSQKPSERVNNSMDYYQNCISNIQQLQDIVATILDEFDQRISALEDKFPKYEGNPQLPFNGCQHMEFKMLFSNPPQYQYQCITCGFIKK